MASYNSPNRVSASVYVEAPWPLVFMVCKAATPLHVRHNCGLQAVLPAVQGLIAAEHLCLDTPDLHAACYRQLSLCTRMP